MFIFLYSLNKSVDKEDYEFEDCILNMNEDLEGLLN